MTKEEYQAIAKQIFDELESFKESDCKITNIGELFALKIINGLGSVSEPTPKSGIIKEAKINIENKLESIDTEPSIFEPPLKSHTERIFIIFLFRTLQYMINTWDNIENVLLYYGLKNPSSVIDTIKTIADMPNTNDSYELMRKFIYWLINNGNDKLLSLFLGGYFDLYRTFIIDIFKLFSSDNEAIIQFLKSIKCLGEKYPTLYKERMAFYHYLMKKLPNDTNRIGDYFKDMGIEGFPENMYTELTFEMIDGGENDDEESDEEDISDEKFAVFFVDLMFILYRFIYKDPQYLIKLGFLLTSDKFSPEIQEAMFSSFSSKDYNSLIQYEYEWWCKETGQTLSLPYPFSDEPLNKSSTSIHDYDLYAKHDIVNKTPIRDKKRIEHDLEPYFTIFQGSSNKKGHVYKSKYSSSMIDLADNIKGSKAVYGFAYILFKSRYFNWGSGRKFDSDFVQTIANVFMLEDEMGTEYFENKAIDAAKKY